MSIALPKPTKVSQKDMLWLYNQLAVLGYHHDQDVSSSRFYEYTTILNKKTIIQSKIFEVMYLCTLGESVKRLYDAVNKSSTRINLLDKCHQLIQKIYCEPTFENYASGICANWTLLLNLTRNIYIYIWYSSPKDSLK